ncbi:MAG: alpha/beta fold hydrolase [Candidatus Binatia bacterium]|nr:alpha/beta fold hydrolase [Candidatus Binatia bacterium]
MWHRYSLAVVAGVLLGLLGGCGGDGETSAYVVRREFVAVDPTRRTPPNGSFPGAAERTIRFLVWQDESEAARSTVRPLLVLAHGFGGLPEKFEAFARAIAGEGIVVAAPAFPLTNQNAPGGHETGLRDLVHQPADVSFVLQALLAADADPASPLYTAFSARQIAVLGHSLGAVTLLGLTRKQCCFDERIRAAIFVAAPSALDAAFGADRVEPLAAPNLFIHGTADNVVPIAVGRGLYATARPPRAFIGVLGAGHSDLLESQIEPPIAARRVMQEAVVAFLRAVFAGGEEDWMVTLARLRSEGHDVDFVGLAGAQAAGEDVGEKR